MKLKLKINPKFLCTAETCGSEKTAWKKPHQHIQKTGWCEFPGPDSHRHCTEVSKTFKGTKTVVCDCTCHRPSARRGPRKKKAGL